MTNKIVAELESRVEDLEAYVKEVCEDMEELETALHNAKEEQDYTRMAIDIGRLSMKLDNARTMIQLTTAQIEQVERSGV